MGTVFLVPMAVDSILGIMMLWIAATLPDLRHRILNLAKDPLLWCVVALLLFLGLSVAWSSKPTAPGVIQIWLRIILSFCFIFLVSESLREQSALETYLYRAIMFGALLSALICIILYLDSPPADNRMQGLFRFNNTGQAGRIFSAALPFLVAGFFLNRGAWRFLAALALIAALTSVILTDTRAAWLGGILGIVSYGISTRQDKAAIFLSITAIFCTLFTALMLWALQYPDSVVHNTFWPRGDSFRLAIWSAHIEEVLTRAPLFGQGMLTQVWMSVGKQSFQGAHSMYLSVAIQIGIPGLLLFLITMIWCGARLVRHLHIRVARLGLSLLSIGAVVFIFGGDRLIDKVNFVWFVFWFPMAAAFAVNAIDAAPENTIKRGS